MTSPGKLNEVEQKITKKTTKLTIAKVCGIFYCRTMDSADIKV